MLFPKNGLFAERKEFFFFPSYLHNGIEGRISPDTKVSAGHIVTNGCRQHTERDAKLLIVGPSLIQLQQTL